MTQSKVKANEWYINKHEEKLMGSKFANIPVDEDTIIIYQQEALLGNYSVLYQKWRWEYVVAESLIFANEDIADLSDEALTKEVKESPMMNKQNSRVTLKKTDDGFTFVNFNFEVLE
jgi:hypothetical protein